MKSSRNDIQKDIERILVAKKNENNSIFVSLIALNSAPKFDRGNLLWEYIESKRHAESTNGVYCDRYENFFSQSPVKFEKYREIYPSSSTDLYLLHGRDTRPESISAISRCIDCNIPIVYEEDSFIQYVAAYAWELPEKKFRSSFGMIVDSLGPYYDATKQTCLELELNSDYEYKQQDIDRARRLIQKIVSNRITKYNNQPLELATKEFKTGRPIVLVVDQAYGDWSIKKGYADQNTFVTMLEAAIDENPESLILVKVHPDMIVNPKRGSGINKKLGHYEEFRIKTADKKRVKFLAAYANPYSLIELATKIYVCTSQFGFEALMAGKEVHIWGSPYYAGWGLGIQRTCSPAIQRRKRKHSIEEVFISSYLNFSRYINPLTGTRCELEELLDSVLILREEYFAWLPGNNALKKDEPNQPAVPKEKFEQNDMEQNSRGNANTDEALELLQTLEKLLKNTARVDVRNIGADSNDIEIVEISESIIKNEPMHWIKHGGQGRWIESAAGQLTTRVRCHGSGNLEIVLRGRDVRDGNGNRIPHWVNFTSCKVNGEEKIAAGRIVCHDRPFRNQTTVHDNDEVFIEATWTADDDSNSSICALVGKAVWTFASVARSKLSRLVTTFSLKVNSLSISRRHKTK